jgi:hypothetical protein
LNPDRCHTKFSASFEHGFGVRPGCVVACELRPLKLVTRPLLQNRGIMLSAGQFFSQETDAIYLYFSELRLAQIETKAFFLAKIQQILKVA